MSSEQFQISSVTVSSVDASLARLVIPPLPIITFPGALGTCDAKDSLSLPLALLLGSPMQLPNSTVKASPDDNYTTKMALLQCVAAKTPQWQSKAILFQTSINWLRYLQHFDRRWALELFLQHCGWLDSRLFSADALLMFHTLPHADQVQRRQICTLISTVVADLKQRATVADERRLQHFTQCDLTQSQAADIMAHLLQNYVSCLAKKSQACSLMQTLFELSSLETKRAMIREAQRDVISLSKHKRGNYFMSSIFKYLHAQRRSKDPRDKENAMQLCGEFEALLLGESVQQFADMAEHKHSSFVLKCFLQCCDRKVKQSMAVRLGRHGYLAVLKDHHVAKFVMRKLSA